MTPPLIRHARPPALGTLSKELAKLGKGFSALGWGGLPEIAPMAMV